MLCRKDDDVAGPERHDGEAPYSFVVYAWNLEEARRAVVTLPFWLEWYEEQRGWGDYAEENPDVLFVEDESYRGLPKWGVFNDLRAEQAAAIAA